MDSAVSLETPTTVEAPVIDAQPQATPDAVGQIDPSGQPEVQADSNAEQWIELPTGSKYRTVEDLIAGATEKDRYIQQLLQAQRTQPLMPQQPMQDAPDPIDVETQRIINKYAAKGVQVDPQAAREHAEMQIEIRQSVKQEVMAEYRMEQQRREIAELGRVHPELFDDFGLEVHEKYKPRNAVEHQLYLDYERKQRGITAPAGTPQRLPDNVRQMVTQPVQQRQSAFTRPVNPGVTSAAQTQDPPELTEAITDALQSPTWSGPMTPERQAAIAQNMRTRYWERKGGIR